MGTMVHNNKTVWLTKRVSKFAPKKFYIICLRANPLFLGVKLLIPFCKIAHYKVENTFSACLKKERVDLFQKFHWRLDSGTFSGAN
jgi:hypothetical protein